MTKRRRERDRPKAGPEAAYHPNKRVLLSYESDEGEVQTEAFTLQPQDAGTNGSVDDAGLASYQIDEYIESEGEVVPDNPPRALNAAKFADHAASPDLVQEVDDEEDVDGAGEEYEHYSQAPQHQARGLKNDHPTSQRPAFGLPEEWYENADGGYDSTTEEAMAYLDSVRSERQALPEILVATRQVHKASDVQEANEVDTDDYLVEDGTYIGQPDTTTAIKDDLNDPQRAFTHSLKTRFLEQRRQLSMPASTEAVARLGDGYPTSWMQNDTKAHVEWHRVLASRAPQPAQLRSLDQESVCHLLALVKKAYLVKGMNVKTITSAWIWSLLCKLEDVGTMNNAQIYPLRELGKKVVLLDLHFRDPEAAAQLEALEQSGEADVGGGAQSSLDSDLAANEASEQPAAAKSSSQVIKSHNAKPTDNTLATFDMILVVIGEVFGQRDLLEFRRKWRGNEKAAV